MDDHTRTFPMSDTNKLSLARAIHGTPHATRDSFSPSTWAGVERAWAWVEKHYQPKEPTVKQENEPMRAIPGTSMVCRHCMCRWKRHADGTFSLYDANAKPCRRCDNAPDFLDAMRYEMPDDEPPTHKGVPMDAGTRLDDLPGAHASESTPPWTEAQREAAFDLWIDLCEADGRFEMCAAIAKVAPAFIKATSVVKVSRHYGEVGIDIDVVGSDARSMHVEMIPWSEIDRCRPAPSPAPAGVPTPVSCPCSKCGHGRHEHDRYGSCLASGSGHGGFCLCGRYEDKDGASVPGDSGSQAGINNERGSGRPTSENHDDRETSTPYAPKEQAPSTICGVAPWPDRVELARLVRKTRFDYVNERDWHGEPASVDFMHADAALEAFAPALRTRDERIAEQAATIATLTKERDELEKHLAAIQDMSIDAHKANIDRDMTFLTVQRLTDRTVHLIDECRRHKRDKHELRERIKKYEAQENREKALSVEGAMWRERAERRDVRRITREDIDAVLRSYDAALHNLSRENAMKAALRAIGFEVES